MPATNPLDQLKDIHLPEDIGFFPLALGWWLLVGVFIIVLIASVIFYKYRKKTAHRYTAIQHLHKLFDDHKKRQQSHELAAQVNSLLKIVALQSYPYKQVSRLTQEEWLAFLDNSANTEAFSQGAGQILLSAPYDEKPQLIDAEGLKQCCIHWIRSHK